MRASGKQMKSEKRVEVNGQDLSRGTRETWPKVAIIVLNWNDGSGKKAGVERCQYLQ